MSEQQEKLRQVLKAATEDPEVLRQLREEPKALGYRFDLSETEVAHLERADMLFTLAASSTQTTSPITITVTVSHALPE